MDLLELNLRTAKPLMELLLAIEELEPPIRDLPRAWSVSQRYLLLPQRGGRPPLAGVQVRHEGPEGEEPILTMTWARVVVDEPDDPEAEVRTISLAFGFPDRMGMEVTPTDLWSDRFPSLDAFLEAARADPNVDWLLRDGAPEFGELFVDVGTVAALDEGAG